MKKVYSVLPFLLMSIFPVHAQTIQPNTMSTIAGALQGSPSTPAPTNPANTIQVVNGSEQNNRVNLNAVGRQEVEQDNLIITMSLTVQDPNPQNVQEVLNREINSAMTIAKENQNEQLTVRTGQFSVYPHYEKQALVGWIGQGTIILEGEDFSQVGRTAAQMKNLVISNIAMGLSVEKADELKDITTKQAIDNFRAEAQKVTQMFGFNNYRIKEVSVNYNQPIMPMRASMAMMAKSNTNEASTLNVEPGKTSVEANVSGTIEMY